MDQYTITHPLLKAEFDTLTTERIASIGDYVRPYRANIPTIQPDLYLFDRGNDLPGFSPPVDDHREKLNKERRK